MHLPFLPTREYLVDNAKFLAVASNLAYLVPPDHRPQSATPAAASLAAELGLTARGFGASGGGVDTQGFVGWSDPAEGPGFRVLAFRGTEPRQLVDWLVDARAAQVLGPPTYTGMIHDGFRAALGAVWPQVCQILASRPDAADWPLFVTGHSLGGALATMASCPPAGLACAKPTATYTFGSPRVGDPAFCAAYGGPQYRVVNKLDIVPELPLAGAAVSLAGVHLPPARGPAGALAGRLNDFFARASVGVAYGHVGELVYIPPSGPIVRGGQRPGWSAAAVAMALATRGKSWWDGVADHGIANYVAALHA